VDTLRSGVIVPPPNGGALRLCRWLLQVCSNQPQGVMDEKLSEFLRDSIQSVWNVEILLKVFGQPGRAWRPAELVQELRASDFVVSQGAAGLQQAGLVVQDADSTIRYAPASAEANRLVQQLERVYRERPSAVTKALFSAPSGKLQTFADAFRFKKD
jgi:hypothetical protein